MLLVVQNGYVTPNITRYLDEEYEIIKSFETDLSTIDIDKYSIIIILGGNQSVTRIDTHPPLLKLVEMIKKCFKIKKPLLGICLGCQLIAHALGCQIKTSLKLYIGYDTNIMGHQDIFRCHIDYVVPNNSITVLEYFDRMPYLYKHDDITYGIQCHPDITPECIKKYINHAEFLKYANENKDVINKKNQEIIINLLNKIRDKK